MPAPGEARQDDGAQDDGAPGAAVRLLAAGAEEAAGVAEAPGEGEAPPDAQREVPEPWPTAGTVLVAPPRAGTRAVHPVASCVPGGLPVVVHPPAAATSPAVRRDVVDPRVLGEAVASPVDEEALTILPADPTCTTPGSDLAEAHHLRRSA